MMKNKIRLEISGDDPDVAYLYFPNHPGEGGEAIVQKQIQLSDVITNYKGPELYLDIDNTGKVIGLEILI